MRVRFPKSRRRFRNLYFPGRAYMKRRVAWRLGMPVEPSKRVDWAVRRHAMDDPYWTKDIPRYSRDDAAAFALLAACNRLWGWHVEVAGDKDRGVCWGLERWNCTTSGTHKGEAWEAEGDGPTPALAITRALLHLKDD